MLKFQTPVVLQMQDGELLAVDDVWLSVVRGRVWITQAADPDDHFLDGGQAIKLSAGSCALVGAEGPAQVSLVAAPSRWQALKREASKWVPRFTFRRPSWTSPPTN
ncbi:MAG TPA: DUF2917 domain-containing protein [Burkholderiaceae bacterium]|jgi:hypothetical protein|nr:DUF2917 domain-containing protein [Burkholderiaceae bacterium]